MKKLIILCMLLVVGCSRKEEVVETVETTEYVEPTKETIPSVTEYAHYEPSLSIYTKDDGRIEIKEYEIETEPYSPLKEYEPIFDLDIKVFSRTTVPEKAVNGDSWLGYLNRVSYKDFSVGGYVLSEEDYQSSTKVLVGVDQNRNDYEKGDLQSVGWLMDNLSILPDNAVIKFTNLHVIGNVSGGSHMLLCSYDWYSAFGLKDVLVVVEDTTNTLTSSNISSGDEFSVSVFKKNLSIKRVQGQRVLIAKYYTFN